MPSHLVRVVTWHPDNLYSSETPQALLVTLMIAVRDAYRVFSSTKKPSDTLVFVAPEMYFHHSYELNANKQRKISTRLTKVDVELITATLCKFTKDAKDLILFAGSIEWFQPKNKSTRTQLIAQLKSYFGRLNRGNIENMRDSEIAKKADDMLARFDRTYHNTLLVVHAGTYYRSDKAFESFLLEANKMAFVGGIPICENSNQDRRLVIRGITFSVQICAEHMFDHQVHPTDFLILLSRSQSLSSSPNKVAANYVIHHDTKEDGSGEVSHKTGVFQLTRRPFVRPGFGQKFCIISETRQFVRLSEAPPSSVKMRQTTLQVANRGKKEDATQNGQMIRHPSTTESKTPTTLSAGTIPSEKRKYYQRLGIRVKG